MNLTKIQAQLAHAKIRAWERYGLNFNHEIRKDFLRKIRTKQAFCIYTQELDRRLYLIDKKYFVIYSNRTKNIITFLLPQQVGYAIMTNQEWKEKHVMKAGFVGIGDSLK